MNLPDTVPSSSREAPGNVPLPFALKQNIKDGMVALALGAWCFLRSWANLLFDGNRYYDNPEVRPVELLALAANILAAGLLIWLGIRLWRRCQTGVASLALDLLFLSLLVFPADFVRGEIVGLKYMRILELVKDPPVILGLVIVLTVLIWKHRLAARTAALVIVATLPVALFVFIKIALACCHLINLQGCSGAVSPPLLPVRPGQPRIVWIIFDETDYRLAFAQRPARLALPEFDRLRQTALFADHAYAPADGTLISMPALISGRRLSGVCPDGCDLQLKMIDPPATNDWTAMPSIFSRAREMGVNTALVGWYLPYARLLGVNLNYCSWYPMPNYQPVNSTTFFGSMEQELACLAWPFRGSHIFIKICQASLRDSLAVASDPKYGLILLHLPPPHSPGIYLPEKHEFTWRVMPATTGYFNNLALADNELGAVRRTMEGVGQWDKSWVILSADHSWRRSKMHDGVRDLRVPFLVKPPGAGQALTYSNQMNTVVTHDLILAILRDEVTNQSGAAAWLDAHARPDLPFLNGTTE